MSNTKTCNTCEKRDICKYALDGLQGAIDFVKESVEDSPLIVNIKCKRWSPDKESIVNKMMKTGGKVND